MANSTTNTSRSRGTRRVSGVQAIVAGGPRLAHLPIPSARSHWPSFGANKKLKIGRCLSGLRRTDLFTDLADGHPHTLVIPVDAAFDVLPWSFESLLRDDSLLELRFDLFEYLVATGTSDADAPVRCRRTLQGEWIASAHKVAGQHGSADILASALWGNTTLHAVESCVLPTSLQHACPRRFARGGRGRS